MIDDPNIRKQLLETAPGDPDQIVGELGDAYFTALDAALLRDCNPQPQIVLTEQIGEVNVQVVEGVALGEDDNQPMQRGFLYMAMAGDLEMRASRRVGGVLLPGRINGGVQLAMSTVSARDALDRARSALTAELTGQPLAKLVHKLTSEPPAVQP